MKNFLALSAFALVMTLPLTSSAGTLTSTFVTSSNATSTIVIGDTITLEISLSITAGLHISTLFFSLSGDIADAPAPAAPTWPGVDGLVTDWSWAYKTGGKVKFPTNGVITPAPTQPMPTPVLQANGFFGGNYTSDGTTRVMGTVTITATAAGSFQAGAFMIPGLDTFEGTDGADSVVSVSAFNYLVNVPEPSTALLLGLGLGGLGVMSRKRR